MLSYGRTRTVYFYKSYSGSGYNFGDGGRLVEKCRGHLSLVVLWGLGSVSGSDTKRRSTTSKTTLDHLHHGGTTPTFNSDKVQTNDLRQHGSAGINSRRHTHTHTKVNST